MNNQIIINKIFKNGPKKKKLLKESVARHQIKMGANFSLAKMLHVNLCIFMKFVMYHGGDSNDATCAVVRVICIPSHAKPCCRPSI